MQRRPSKLDFSLNERNFIKTYAKGLSGPKKFVLLLAYITKGKVGVDLQLPVIRSKWNKMTAQNLLGYEFNLYYSNQAKTQGWVDSKKTGVYHLRDGWKYLIDYEGRKEKVEIFVGKYDDSPVNI